MSSELTPQQERCTYTLLPDPLKLLVHAVGKVRRVSRSGTNAESSHLGLHALGVGVERVPLGLLLVSNVALRHAPARSSTFVGDPEGGSDLGALLPLASDDGVGPA